MSDLMLRANNLSKRFKIYSHPWSRALECMSMGRTKHHTDLWALTDASLGVELIAACVTDEAESDRLIFNVIEAHLSQPEKTNQGPVIEG